MKVRADAALLERRDAGDGRAARARHHVLQLRPGACPVSRMSLRRAEHGLGGERHGGRAVEPHLDAAVGQRLDDDGDVGGAGAATARSPRPWLLVEHDHAADRAEHLLGGLEVARLEALRAAMAVAPCSTSAGVFGITRMMRASLPSRSRRRAGRHAGGDRDEELRPVTAGAISRSTGAMICGLTARMTTSASRTQRALSPWAVMPYCFGELVQRGPARDVGRADHRRAAPVRARAGP